MANTNADPHAVLMVVIAQIVFVVIMSEIATFNDSLGSVITTFILGLWLVYLINEGPALFNTLNSKIGLNL